MLHDTYKYFSKSPKRSAKWLNLQSSLGVKELKINKYIEARWLSREFCISRIFQRWDELIEYFTNEGNKDSKRILEILNELIKVIFSFSKKEKH